MAHMAVLQEDLQVVYRYILVVIKTMKDRILYRN